MVWFSEVAQVPCCVSITPALQAKAGISTGRQVRPSDHGIAAQLQGEIEIGI